MRARLLAAAVVVAAGAAMFTAFAGAAGATHSGYLKTPSGSVYCDYLYGGETFPTYRYVRCGFKGKLSPQEAKPKGGCPKDTDYVGNRMEVLAKGRGQTEPCAGDAGPFGNPKAAVAIPYGQTWHGGPFSCTSSKQGMRCKRRDGHGFYLAKTGWRVF
jgi:Family of unknown function (DUF6636)